MLRALYICLIWLLCPSVWAGTLNSVEFSQNPTAQESRVRILGNDLSKPSVFEMLEGGRRIVIDYADTDSALKGDKGDAGQTRLAGQGPVSQIRVARRGDAGTRLVIDLKAGASLKSHIINAEFTDVLIHDPTGSNRRPPHTKARYFKKAIPFPILKPYPTVKPRKPPIIVIDPGHGGHDPGAVGQEGTHEKTVTLKAALELKKLLEKTGRYSVILTRNGDRYVEHEDRIKMARIKSADLFISIHADSTGSSQTRGASVYTLADRAIGRSKRIVNSQNWIMDVDLSTQTDSVGDILVDLAQRKTFSQSEKFADRLVTNLSKSTHLVRNTHRRAGYYVLLAPDVPAVLLELGFISNRQDEKLLNSARHRQKVLKSVVGAIDGYFADQNP